jgi:hypothetical protein
VRWTAPSARAGRRADPGRTGTAARTPTGASTTAGSRSAEPFGGRGFWDRGLVVAGRLPDSVTCISEVVAGEFQAFKPGPSMLTSALEFLSLDLNDPESPMYRLLPGPQMRGRPCISRHGARALLYYQTVPPGVDYLAFQIRAKCARVIVPRCTWKPRPWMLAEATRRHAAERAGTWAAVAAAPLEDE